MKAKRRTPLQEALHRLAVHASMAEHASIYSDGRFIERYHDKLVSAYMEVERLYNQKQEQEERERAMAQEQAERARIEQEALRKAIERDTLI